MTMSGYSNCMQPLADKWKSLKVDLYGYESAFYISTCVICRSESLVNVDGITIDMYRKCSNYVFMWLHPPVH